MLTRIEIKNFRGLAALEVELAQATALVGPNSCGKTTVLHAVQLACAALQFAYERGKIDVDKDGWLTLYGNLPVRDDQSFLPTTRWSELFLDANPEHVIQIILHFTKDHTLSELRVSLHGGRADALRMSVAIHAADGSTVRSVIDHASPGRGRRRANWQDPILEMLSSVLPRAIFIPAFYGVVREEEYRARGAVEALLQSGQQGQVVRNLLMRLRNLEGINNFLPLAGIQAKIDRCTPQQQTDIVRHLEVLFRDRNGRLELSSAGTGLASLVALYAAIQNYQDAIAEGRAVIFMFDEPEAHLHPRLQGEVAAKLVDMIAAAGAQLICATHSVEMINRFGRDSRAVVLRIDRDGGGHVKVLRSEDDRMDDLGQWCDLSPFAKLNLLATRRIVFFEGPSDYKILSACARLYLGSDLGRLKRFDDFTPAPLSGTSNLTAKDVLKKALLPVFKHLPPGDQVRVVRLLDRDYGRDRKQDRQKDAAAHFEELDVIWSRHSIESLFLDPECLTDWLDAALKDLLRPTRLDRAALLALVNAAIAAADVDPGLNKAASEQLTPRLVEGRTNQDIIGAMREAVTRVESAPATYQRGHDRSHYVLNHVRQALLADVDTKRLANRVKHDISQIVSETQLQPNLLLPPALFPGEIKQVLDFMAES